MMGSMRRVPVICVRMAVGPLTQVVDRGLIIGFQ